MVTTLDAHRRAAPPTARGSRLLLFALLVTLGAVLGGAPPGKAAWTVLVYMAADNNLHPEVDECSLVAMTHAMSKARGGRVNVVVEQVTPPGAQMQRWRIVDGGRQRLDGDAGVVSVNTSDPENLTAFIDWGTRQFPSDHVMLVIWSHANGVLDWLKPDPQPSASSGPKVATPCQAGDAGLSPMPIAASVTTGSIAPFDLSTGQLADAISKAKTKVDVIGFDACLMSLVEVAYELSAGKNAPTYMVASERIETADGWPYDPILTKLTQNPDMNGEVLARTIVEAYRDHQRSRGKGSASAVIFLPRMAKLAEEFALVVGELDRGGSVRTTVQHERAKTLLKYYGSYYVDLAFIGQLKSLRSASRFDAALRAAVLLGATSGDSETHGYLGVGVYYPCPAAKQIATEYRALRFATKTGWADLVQGLPPCS